MPTKFIVQKRTFSSLEKTFKVTSKNGQNTYHQNTYHKLQRSHVQIFMSSPNFVPDVSIGEKLILTLIKSAIIKQNYQAAHLRPAYVEPRKSICWTEHVIRHIGPVFPKLWVASRAQVCRRKKLKYFHQYKKILVEVWKSFPHKKICVSQKSWRPAKCVAWWESLGNTDIGHKALEILRWRRFLRYIIYLFG